MDILVLEPRDKAAMLVVHIIIFFRRIYMKIEFVSQRREMLLLLTTIMAAVTSRANRQQDMYLVIRQVVNKQGYWFFESCSTLNLFCVFLVKVTDLKRCPYLVIWKNHAKPLSRVSGSVFNKIVKHKTWTLKWTPLSVLFCGGRVGIHQLGAYPLTTTTTTRAVKTLLKQ